MKLISGPLLIAWKYYYHNIDNFIHHKEACTKKKLRVFRCISPTTNCYLREYRIHTTLKFKLSVIEATPVARNVWYLMRDVSGYLKMYDSVRDLSILRWRIWHRNTVIFVAQTNAHSKKNCWKPVKNSTFILYRCNDSSSTSQCYVLCFFGLQEMNIVSWWSRISFRRFNSD